MTHTIPEHHEVGRVVPVAAIQRLSSELNGTAISPDDADYEEACAGFDVATRRRPDAVDLVKSSIDVADTVSVAGRYGLPVAVMGTGHHGVRPFEHGLLINNSRMTNVEAVVSADDLPTPPVGTKTPSPEELTAIAASHGIEIVGPLPATPIAN